MDCSPPGSSVHGFSRQEYWSGLPFPPPNSVNVNLQQNSLQFSGSMVSDSATPWTAARQASLSITNSRSLPKLTSIESVMPSNHLILYRPLLLPPSIYPSIRVSSKESVIRITQPKYKHQNQQVYELGAKTGPFLKTSSRNYPPTSTPNRISQVLSGVQG